MQNFPFEKAVANLESQLGALEGLRLLATEINEGMQTGRLGDMHRWEQKQIELLDILDLKRVEFKPYQLAWEKLHLEKRKTYLEGRLGRILTAIETLSEEIQHQTPEPKETLPQHVDLPGLWQRINLSR